MTTFDASFARLWVGSTASGLATWALPFLLGLCIVDGVIGAAELGMALSARTVGFLIAVPVGGVLADRAGPRIVILLASLLPASGIPLIIAGLALSKSQALSCILVGAAVSGMGQGACRPAFQAMTPRLVPVNRLQSANAALSLSVRVTALVGPLAATTVALFLGLRVTFLIVALLWLASAFVPPFPATAASPENRTTHSGLHGFLRDFREGFDEARRHRWFVLGLIALTSVIATGYSVVGVLVPVLSEQRYGGASLLATTATAYTSGALLAAFGIARWRPAAAGVVAFSGLAFFGFVPFSLLLDLPLAFPVMAFFLAGVGIELFNVLWFTAAHREVPPQKLARVSSIDFIFSYGLAPLGLAAIMPLTQTFGMTSVLVVYGLVCFLVPLAVLLHSDSRRLASCDQRPVSAIDFPNR